MGPDSAASRLLVVAFLAGAFLLPAAGSPAFSSPRDPEGKAASVETRSAGASNNCLNPEGHYPAFDPDPPFDVLHYEIEVDVIPATQFLNGRVTIDLAVLQAGVSQISLDYCGADVRAVSVAGQTGVTYQWTGGVLNVLLGTPADTGDTLSITVDYDGFVETNRAVFFPPVSDPPEFATTFTFVEPEDARRWFPSHDVPDDKATLDLIVIVPEDLVVGSNGVLLEEELVVPGGRRRFHWREQHPIATYLVSFAAARYVILEDNSFPGVPITNYVHAPDSAAAVPAFDVVPEMLDFFIDTFGPYDFDKYGHAVAPFPGGMEHQSLTTVGRFAVTAPEDNEWLVAHELAHQWWGDALTPRDWRHIWLNEGFASYGDALWAEHARGRAGLNERMTVFSEIFKLGFLTRGIVSTVLDPPADYLFGFTVYDKGAWVLHMLRRVIGDQAFFGALRDYHAAYRYGNVVTDDFIAIVEAHAGQDLDWFFTPWLQGVGLPRYGYRWRTDPLESGGQGVTVQIRQMQESPFFPMPVDLGIVALGDTIRTTVFVDENPDTFHVELAGAVPPTDVVIDPDNWLLKTVEFEGTFVPVGLLSFTAERQGPNAVVAWSVTEEGRRNLYRLHRQEPDAVRVPVRQEPLTGSDAYQVTDLAAPSGPVDYWLEEVDTEGVTTWFGPLRLARVGHPPVLRLGVFPNPFREFAAVDYTVPEESPSLRLTIHDVTGRLVRTLVNGSATPGAHQALWDGKSDSGLDMPPGVYFLKLDAGVEGTLTARIARLR